MVALGDKGKITDEDITRFNIAPELSSAANSEDGRRHVTWCEGGGLGQVPSAGEVGPQPRRPQARARPTSRLQPAATESLTVCFIAAARWGMHSGVWRNW